MISVAFLDRFKTSFKNIRLTTNKETRRLQNLKIDFKAKSVQQTFYLQAYKKKYLT